MVHSFLGKEEFTGSSTVTGSKLFTAHCSPLCYAVFMFNKLIAASTVFAGLLLAQTQHSATLSWTDNLNPTGTTYNVYRATGLCSGTPTFSKLATAVATKNYVDNTVTPGNYCYTVSATFNSVESAQSTAAAAAVPSFPPTSLQITVQ